MAEIWGVFKEGKGLGGVRCQMGASTAQNTSPQGRDVLQRELGHLEREWKDYLNLMQVCLNKRAFFLEKKGQNGHNYTFFKQTGTLGETKKAFSNKKGFFSPQFSGKRTLSFAFCFQ